MTTAIRLLKSVRNAAGQAADRFELLRLGELLLDALTLLHLAHQAKVGARELRSPLGNALLERVTGLPELLLHALSREEIGDLVLGRRDRGGARALVGQVLLHARFDALGVGHDEAATRVALRAAEELGRHELHAEAGLAPPRRVAGAHDAGREITALARAHPRVGLERVGVLVEEVALVARDGPRRRVDVDLRPPRMGEVDRTRGETRDRVHEPHASVEVLRVAPAYRMGQVVEDVARELVGFRASAISVELLDESEELDGQRRRAHEDVSLARDLDGPVLRVVHALTEVARHHLFGGSEWSGHHLRHANGLQRSPPSFPPKDNVPQYSTDGGGTLSQGPRGRLPRSCAADDARLTDVRLWTRDSTTRDHMLGASYRAVADDPPRLLQALSRLGSGEL
jgi:hypothetical protein